jgi:hypothetical protein
VILLFVVILVAVVKLLAHGAVCDEVGGVTSLEVAHGVSSNLVVENALILLIRSCSKR